MLIERRAYTLHRGRAADFWDAQQKWTARDLRSPLMSRLIGYFTGIAEEVDLVVHLYAFEDAARWRQAYESFYAVCDPSYFKLVRPWVREQESDLFVPAVGYPTNWLVAPQRKRGCGANLVTTGPLLESRVDLEPGAASVSLDHPIAANPGWRQSPPLAVLRSMTGRLHRLLRYDPLTPDDLFTDDLSAVRHNADDAPVAASSGIAARLLVPAPIEDLRAYLPPDAMSDQAKTVAID